MNSRHDLDNETIDSIVFSYQSQARVVSQERGVVKRPSRKGQETEVMNPRSKIKGQEVEPSKQRNVLECTFGCLHAQNIRFFVI